MGTSWWLRNARTASRRAFGPFEVDAGRRRLMHSVTQFEQEQAPHVRESQLCATCHTLITDALGPDGNVIGSLPEQMNYQEWRHSSFVGEGRSCQSCHMPPAEGPVRVSSVLGDYRDRLARHTFLGGNAFMLRMMSRNRSELGVEATPAELEATARATIRQLEQETAIVAVDQVVLRGGTLAFDVVVTNLTGHKFPTGFPSRRAWLHVTVRDREGGTVFESGGVTKAGSIVGNDNDSAAATFEPHYEEITTSDAVQIYESIMGTPAGAPTTGLLHATQYLKDNRLLPRGFDKRTAAPEIAVVGAGAADADFTGAGDRVRYRIRDVRARHHRGRAPVSADRLSLGAKSGGLRRTRAATVPGLLQRSGGDLVRGGGPRSAERGAVNGYRPSRPPRAPDATIGTLRTLLLAILLFGMIGTGTELVLIGHDEDVWQWIPLVLLGIAILASVGMLAIGPRKATEMTRWFRVAMVLLIVSGALGSVLHYQANREFKLEMDPSLSGLALFSSVIRAKTPPSLAPGTMVLLGLVGLASAFRRDIPSPSVNPSYPHRSDGMRQHLVLRLALVSFCLSLSFGGMLSAQVGKGSIVDLNTAAEKDVLALPHMTPAIVKGLIDKRPFGSIVDANAYLIGQSLTPTQLAELYGKAFIHVNLNTGGREEIVLIPGAGNRMVREFAEYRPWKSWAQFDKEISKYVGQPETDRLKQYVFIPVNLNTASDADILSIPGAGPRMVREFKEYRPWKTKEQFEKEIGKYIGAKETARLWRYVVIQ